MPIFADPDSGIGDRLEDFNIPLGRLAGAASAEAKSAFWSLMYGRDMTRRGFDFSMFNERGEVVSSQPSRMVPKDEANRRAASVGLPQFENDVPEAGLEWLIADHQARAARSKLLASGDNSGAVRWTVQRGAEFIASMLDPINVATSALPLSGPASRLLRLGSTIERMSPFMRGIGAGAFEGAAGNLLLEPAQYYYAAREEREYGLADTFMNMVVGGTLGAGIHAGGTGLAKLFKGETPTIPQQVEAAGPEVHARTLQAVDAELAQGITPKAAQELIAYHGTPHTFDKFSLEHVGSGEGNQVYGHGLYFTETKDIAERYRKSLSPAETLNGIRDYLSKQGLPQDLDTAIYHWILGNNKSAIAHAETTARHFREYIDKYLHGGFNPEHKTRKLLQKTEEIISEMQAGTYEPNIPKGNIYEVALAAKNDELLLWDKPLSEQSDVVKDAVNKMAPDLPDQIAIDPRGGSIYKALSERLGGNEQTSIALREAGVRGIKYLDGDSRNAGDGSFNYVIFNDADIVMRGEKTSVDQNSIQNTADVLSGRIENPAAQLTDGRAASVDGDTTIKKSLDLDDPEQIIKDAAEAEKLVAEPTREMESASEEIQHTEQFGKAIDDLIRCIGGTNG